MLRLLIAVFISVLLSGCGKIMMYTFWGIKSPKPETTKSILAYEKKVGYNVAKDNFYIDSSQVSNVWEGAFPKAFIYDSKGNTMLFLDCFAEGENQLKYFFNLPEQSRKPVSDTLRIIMGKDTLMHVAPDFPEIVRLSRSLTDDSNLIKPNTDYYIVYFWSKAFGKVNKRIGSEMEDYIEEHPEFNSSFVKINCDYQKNWGYTKKQIRTEWQ